MPVSEGEIRALVRAGSSLGRLTAPDETAWCVRFGPLEIPHTSGCYRLGYSYEISATSALSKRAFAFPDLGASGFAVVFRPFDRFTEEDDPPEVALGWVGPEQDAQLDAWLARLNGLLRARRLRD